MYDCLWGIKNLLRYKRRKYTHNIWYGKSSCTVIENLAMNHTLLHTSWLTLHHSREHNYTPSFLIKEAKEAAKINHLYLPNNSTSWTERSVTTLHFLHFAKKHNKKGLKKMQTNNVKAMSAWAEALKVLVKPKMIKPRCQRFPAANSTILPSLITPRLGRRLEATWPRVKVSANQSPRFKPQKTPQFQVIPTLQLKLMLPKVSISLWRPHRQGFCLPMWRQIYWCDTPTHYLQMVRDHKKMTVVVVETR